MFIFIDGHEGKGSKATGEENERRRNEQERRAARLARGDEQGGEGECRRGK